MVESAEQGAGKYPTTAPLSMKATLAKIQNIDALTGRPEYHGTDDANFGGWQSVGALFSVPSARPAICEPMVPRPPSRPSFAHRCAGRRRSIASWIPEQDSRAFAPGKSMRPEPRSDLRQNWILPDEGSPELAPPS